MPQGTCVVEDINQTSALSQLTFKHLFLPWHNDLDPAMEEICITCL